MAGQLVVRLMDSSRSKAGAEAARAWDAAVPIVERVLRSVGASGPFDLRPIRQSRWQGGHVPDPPVKVGAVDGHAVRLRIKPGDNSTVWDYALLCRNGTQPPVLHSILFGKLHGKEQAPQHSNGQVVEGTVLSRQEVPADPLTDLAARLSTLRGATERVRQRRARLAVLEETLAKIDSELRSLQHERQLFEEEQIKLELEAEQDVEAAKAEQVIEGLRQLLEPAGGGR